jgi:hypothetical protein
MIHKSQHFFARKDPHCFDERFGNKSSDIWGYPLPSRLNNARLWNEQHGLYKHGFQLIYHYTGRPYRNDWLDHTDDELVTLARLILMIEAVFLYVC